MVEVGYLDCSDSGDFLADARIGSQWRMSRMRLCFNLDRG